MTEPARPEGGEAAQPATGRPEADLTGWARPEPEQTVPPTSPSAIGSPFGPPPGSPAFGRRLARHRPLPRPSGLARRWLGLEAAAATTAAGASPTAEAGPTGARDPFAVVHLDVPPVASGLAVGSLVAGITSVLVSVLVICFGAIGGGANGAWAAGAFAALGGLTGAGAVVAGLLGMRQIRRPAPRRRSASPAVAWPSPGSVVAGRDCCSAWWGWDWRWCWRWPEQGRRGGRLGGSRAGFRQSRYTCIRRCPSRAGG